VARSYPTFVGSQVEPQDLRRMVRTLEQFESDVENGIFLLGPANIVTATQASSMDFLLTKGNVFVVTATALATLQLGATGGFDGQNFEILVKNEQAAELQVGWGSEFSFASGFTPSSVASGSTLVCRFVVVQGVIHNVSSVGHKDTI